MKILNTITLFICFFLLLSTQSLGNQPIEIIENELLKNFTVYVNNEVKISNSECNLDLKSNDVLKIIGKYKPNKTIQITAFNKIYSEQTDEYGDWIFLFSVPYTDDGVYEIKGEVEQDKNDILLCNVTLNQLDVNSNGEDDSKSFLPFLFIIVPVVIAISAYLFLIIKKKKR